MIRKWKTFICLRCERIGTSKDTKSICPDCGITMHCITSESGEASHLDADKPRVDLLPFDSLMEVAEVLRIGAKKYDERNWEKGMPWMKLIGSTLRHIFKWSIGKDLDEEDSLNHLAHAACDILMVLAYQLRNTGTDDRAKLDD